MAELDEGEWGLASEMEDRGVWLLEEKPLRFLRLRRVIGGLAAFELFSALG
jgi:hypothetical protein